MNVPHFEHVVVQQASKWAIPSFLRHSPNVSIRAMKLFFFYLPLTLQVCRADMVTKYFMQCVEIVNELCLVVC